MTHPLLDPLLADTDETARAAVDRLDDHAVALHVSRNDLLYEQGAANDGISLVAHGAVVLEWKRPSGFAVGSRLAKVLRDTRTPARVRLAYLLAYLDDRLADH